MNKKMLVILGVVTVVGAGVLGSHAAFAQESTAQDPMSSLVQKIADKFGLKKDDVQVVFNEHKTEMKARMAQRQEERLSTLVTEGKITEAQKSLILNKMKELQEKRASEKDLKNLSKEEIRSKMEAQKAELETWAKDNGIDLQYLFSFGHGSHMGFGRGMKADK